MKRPLLISFLAILDMALGVILILAALFLSTFLSMFWGALGPILPAPLVGFTMYGFGLSMLAVTMGVFSFVVGYGLWKLDSWAWWLYFISLILGLGLNAFFGNLVSVIFGMFWIVYFLLRRDRFKVGFKAPNVIHKL